MFWCFGTWGIWDLVPWPGIEPMTPALEGNVSTTGPPGTFPSYPSFWSRIVTSQVEEQGDLLLKKKKKDCVYISALTLDSHFIPMNYFLFYFFRFYWSIVALQPCVNFCHPAEWISCTHIYLLFPPSSPLGFIQGYRLSLLPWWFRWQRMCLQCRRHGFGKIRVGNIPWRRACQPTPVLLPRESHGQRSLVGCGPWGPRRVRHDWPANTDWLLKEYTCFKL